MDSAPPLRLRYWEVNQRNFGFSSGKFGLCEKRMKTVLKWGRSRYNERINSLSREALLQEPSRTQLEVKLLGTFQTSYQDGPIPSQAWRQRKTQTLLKLLVSERGRVFSQDQLIDALFSDLDPQKAIINLRARIS